MQPPSQSSDDLRLKNKPLITFGIDPDVPVQVATLAQTLSESITMRRFNMYLFETFAGSALLLAIVGIYGVLAYVVKQRTREIGIRMALGAQRDGIVRMVAWQGMKIALTGMALGMIAAVGLSRLITTMLYDTRATDPVTLFGVSAMLGLAAMLACLQPALRAAKTDPMVALRHE
jgi:ABC-type antimicrobial peptide transport system permease subunit